MDELERRRKNFLKKVEELTKNPTYMVYAVLTAIITLGVYIRTRNLSIIQWRFPIDPDSFAFLRYAKYVAEHGQLMSIDMLRYYPLGWTNLSEFRVISYFIAYLYKLLHVFIPSITIENADVIYPVICFAVAIVFFFLLVKELFNWKVGLVSTAVLAVVPAYLYRTMAGSADKEAFATMVMFAALYFFVMSWKAKSMKKVVISSILSGIFTALTGLTWGGVLFIFLTIATFILINILFEKMNKAHTITFISWSLVTIFILNRLYPERFYLQVFISNMTYAILTFIFFSAILAYLIIRVKYLKEWLCKITKGRIPPELASLLLLLSLVLIAFLIIKGPINGLGDIITEIKGLYIILTKPFGTNRWVLTVAEAHLPSFSDWIAQFSLKYLLMTLAGVTLAFYGMIKTFKKKLLATAVFSTALIGISISRYTPTSILNGSNGLSLFLYLALGIGGLAVLALYPYIKAIKEKDTTALEALKGIDSSILFAIIFFVWFVISAKTAIRLLFIFAPATAIFAGYFTVTAIRKIKLLNNDTYKMIGIIAIIALTAVTLFGFYQASINQARYTGSSYTYQWVQAMDWVRDNTPKDAVFAHWWDYGYYVQTGGERATLSDGGNSRGAINYFIGRHVLTGQNETEALELLKANNATHLLIVYEEIGKYPAFSSIGSDVDYDRYSWISTFQLDPSLIQETRNETILIYRGSTAIDEDFVYQDQIFPQGAAGIGGVMIPISTTTVMEGNLSKTMQEIKQPAILLFYNGQQYQIPLECVFIDNEEKVFPQKGYPGCFRIIPSVDGSNQVNQLGGGLLLSPKVRRTEMTRLFLYDQPSEHFTKVYTDETTGMPLAIYQGRLIGPLKIWEISYPDDLVVPEEYYGTEEPEGVTVVGRNFA